MTDATATAAPVPRERSPLRIWILVADVLLAAGILLPWVDGGKFWIPGISLPSMADVFTRIAGTSSPVVSLAYLVYAAFAGAVAGATLRAVRHPLAAAFEVPSAVVTLLFLAVPLVLAGAGVSGLGLGLAIAVPAAVAVPVLVFADRRLRAGRSSGSTAREQAVGHSPRARS